MNELRVAYNPDFAPFSISGEDRPQGLIIDRLRNIFDKSDISYEFVATNLTDLIPNLESESVDAIAALGITRERGKKYHFSKPILVSGGAWFIPKSQAMIADGEVPKSVITPKRGPLADEIKNRYPEINLITTTDYEAALKGALQGKAMAAALNWHVGRMMIDEKFKDRFYVPKSPYNTVPLGVAVLKKNKEIILQLNINIPDDWGYDPI